MVSQPSANRTTVIHYTRHGDKLVPGSRPRAYSGKTRYYPTACGKVFVTVNVDDTGYPVEVFASLGHVGGCSSAFTESVGRSLSIALRCGVSAAELAAQYIGITCQNGSWDEGRRITSCATAVGLALRMALSEVGISVDGTLDEAKPSLSPTRSTSPVRVGPEDEPSTPGAEGKGLTALNFDPADPEAADALRQTEALKANREAAGL